MRRGNNPEVVMQNNKFVGFNLSSDFTAEHEWGIAGIIRSFGIDIGKRGIDKRNISKYPEKEIKMVETSDAIYLIFNPSFSWEEEKPHVSSELEIGSREISAAWSERDFGIGVSKNDTEMAIKLKVIYKAFQNKDISIWRGGGAGIENAGLVIAITSKIPAFVKADMEEADIDRERLNKAAQDTGIHATLKNADKSYYALSPRWKDGKKKEVIFWLNPMEQDTNNAGWYSIEDLKNWADGKGKIPKVKHEAKSS